jgi:hypothetical protein
MARIGYCCSYCDSLLSIHHTVPSYSNLFVSQTGSREESSMANQHFQIYGIVKDFEHHE